jgi:DNA-binding transcriptional ArsR family regulator
MAYSELIKNFENIRDYVRGFFVYGFLSRSEYEMKSARSYDNERRRIESWLGDYMAYRQDSSGKSVFISVDSRVIPHNPLYSAFKAKSFTDGDITLHFYILDILAGGEREWLSVKEIIDRIEADYLSAFDGNISFDDSTVRAKLREYEELGLLQSAKDGRRVLYAAAENSVDPEGWRDAVAFYSEANPLGLIGSYLLDRYRGKDSKACDYYRFKHHYIQYAVESEVLYDVLSAIGEKRYAEVKVLTRRYGNRVTRIILPLKIFVSTQNGRRYLMGVVKNRISLYRLDYIRSVKPTDVCQAFQLHLEYAEKFMQNMWGVSISGRKRPDHVEMLIRYGDHEQYIPERLEREKRCGTVEPVDDHTLRYSCDLHDAMEMLPWIRTFTGRIAELKSSSKELVKVFHDDLAVMQNLYKE